MFAYKITIENNNQFPVKLLRRHWHIYDSNGSFVKLKGKVLLESNLLLHLHPLINTSVVVTFAQRSVKCKALIYWRT
jgi:uncharacterized protein affecting Mg2+/Co2+ transport